jgi:hypothetical protein
MGTKMRDEGKDAPESEFLEAEFVVTESGGWGIVVMVVEPAQTVDFPDDSRYSDRSIPRR